MKQYLVGHRGAAGISPENTLASFKKAFDLGVDCVECDISLSKDGQLIVFHDNTLDRLTTAKGWVKDYTTEQIKMLTVQNEQIPTLSEVMNLVQSQNKKLVIEVKGESKKSVEQTTEKLIDYIKENKIEDFIILISFWWDALARLKKEFPQITCLLLLCEGVDGAKMLEWCKELGVDGVSSEASYLSKEIVDLFRSNNLITNVWTVNDATTFSLMKEIGVDYITTNFPDRFKI